MKTIVLMNKRNICPFINKCRLKIHSTAAAWSLASHALALISNCSNFPVECENYIEYKN